MKNKTILLLSIMLVFGAYSSQAGGSDHEQSLTIPCQSYAAANSTNMTAASSYQVIETLIPQKPATVRMVVSAAGLTSSATGTVTFVFVPCKADGTGADDPSSSLYRLSVNVAGTAAVQNSGLFSVVGAPALKHAWTINGAGDVVTNLGTIIFYP